MFADPTTDIGLLLVLSGNAGYVSRIEIHPAGWGERLMLLVANQQHRTSFCVRLIGETSVAVVERRPFPTIAYERHAWEGHCRYAHSFLMAHNLVLELLWYLRRMVYDGVPVWQVEEARPLLYDRWITGQEFIRPDFE